MTWSAEIESGFGDLLSEVGEPIEWTDGFGVFHQDVSGGLPLALFKRPGQMILSDMQITDEYAIEYRESDFPGLAHGDGIGVQEMFFIVREVLQGDDPVLKTARLKLIPD